MNTIRSKVMIMANRLVKQGMQRRTAMHKAWVIAKATALHTKIKGTSLRQSELEKLATVNPSEIGIQLRRECHNRYDSNAIAVYAVLKDHRIFFVGYLSKAVACVLAPLFDKGKEPKAKAFRVTGGFNPWVNYGAALSVQI